MGIHRLYVRIESLVVTARHGCTVAQERRAGKAEALLHNLCFFLCPDLKFIADTTF